MSTSTCLNKCNEEQKMPKQIGRIIFSNMLINWTGVTFIVYYKRPFRILFHTVKLGPSPLNSPVGSMKFSCLLFRGETQDSGTGGLAAKQNTTQTHYLNTNKCKYRQN